MNVLKGFMLENFVKYFVKRHLLTNLIFISVIVGGIFSWHQIKKEEMPDVTFDRVMISASYPGATAEEVEHFVTRPIEEDVQGLDGVYRVTSTSSQGTSSVTIELEPDYPNKDEVITEIRSTALDVKLPDDVRDDPRVRVFKTSKKAIIDIAIFDTSTHLLDVKARQKLQEYAHALESQLLNLPEVNSINKSGYLTEEIQIAVDPKKLIEYTIPLSQVMSEVKNNHVRQPAGHIEAKNEPKVTLNAQLDTIEKLNNQIIQAGFQGQAIFLKEIATVKKEFARTKQINKVNGHEAVIFNVVKNSSFGIVESIEAVKRIVKRYEDSHLQGSVLQVVMFDDESIDVRNRLSIITMNGSIGFILILIILFLFLSKRAGLWVAMGIPFTICFTLIASKFLGYSINNVTLAAVIIVMGMVVDDAIVVAEQIERLRGEGLSRSDAAIKGAVQVFLPIVASILTTCIAFVPLFFFSGHFGKINRFIPPIIFLMLGASLLESLVILPGHMQLNWFKSKKQKERHWFHKVEEQYAKVLTNILPHKKKVFVLFVVFLVLSAVVIKTKMKFVMFPNEETREIIISGTSHKEADRYEAAEIAKKAENIISPFIGEQVVAIRTGIARSRRGATVEENKFRMRIEIVPKEKRRESADYLSKLWKKNIEKIDGLEKVVVQKSRWGQSSGSAVEVLVQENDDGFRKAAVDKLIVLMRDHPALTNVEAERPIEIPEYKIDLQREKIKRLSISAVDISSTFRAALEGAILYDLPKGDEEVDVRISIVEDAKRDIENILKVPVENRSDYLVPLRDIVIVEETKTPNSIKRRDMKRTTEVYADMKPNIKMTPLEIAKELEENVFPEVFKSQPTTVLSFGGEIKDTLESSADFRNAIILVLFLIFGVLAILFNSLSRPFIIMLAIPFGLVGVVLAFVLHLKFMFGFFAAIGVLGLSGVVINDSIVMLVKMEREFKQRKMRATNAEIANVAKTRLRAVVLTTVTTVAGLLPTAYGVAGYDAMLAEMMLAMAWGLVFGTLITLVLVPCIYSIVQGMECRVKQMIGTEDE